MPPYSQNQNFLFTSSMLSFLTTWQHFTVLPLYGRGELAVTYRWTGEDWEITDWSSRLPQEITDHLWGIYRLYPNLIKGNWRMSTCNWLDLQTLGSPPVMPTKLPNHCFQCTQCCRFTLTSKSSSCSSSSHELRRPALPAISSPFTWILSCPSSVMHIYKLGRVLDALLYSYWIYNLKD